MAAAAVGLAGRVRTFYEVNGDLTTTAGPRRYLLHLPDGHDPDQPRPLVVVIHGFMQSPGHQRLMSRWDDLAAAHGFLTVYPLGTGIPPHWGSPSPVGFIAELVDHVSARFAVDADRVYASGMSNGGGLAADLALALPETFAAVGSVAGLYRHFPEPAATGRAVPLIAFHGELDRIVPIAGGVRRLGHPAPPVADWLDAYARRCGCTRRTEEPVAGTVTRVRYSGGRDGAEVVWYRIPDAGHTWPGGVPLPEVVTGPTSTLLDATALSWEFFSRHPRRSPACVPADPSARRA